MYTIMVQIKICYFDVIRFMIFLKRTFEKHEKNFDYQNIF